MGTIHVYVPTIGWGWQLGANPDPWYHFLISEIAAFKDSSASAADGYPRRAYLVHKLNGRAAGETSKKCVVVEYRLRGVIGERGLASGYALGLPVWKLSEDAAKWAWDPLLINFEHTCGLSYQLTFPLTHKKTRSCMRFSLSPVPSRLLIFAHLYLYPPSAHIHTLVAAPKSSRVSPLCVPSVIGDLRVFRGWVGGSDLT